MRKPQCPGCGAPISFLDVREQFSCPSCQRALKSTGRGSIVAFEIAAFVLLGFPLGFLIWHESYFFAVTLGVIWSAVEIVVRNGAIRLELVAPEAGPSMMLTSSDPRT